MRHSRIFRHLGAAWLLALVIFLAACDQSPSPTLTPSLSDPALTVTQGKSVSTTLTVKPVNFSFSGPVALALVVEDNQGKAVQGVTLSPDSVTLSTDKSTTQKLTLSVAASVPVGSYHATLTISSGNLSKPATLTLKVQAAAPTTGALKLIISGIPTDVTNPPIVEVKDGSNQDVINKTTNGTFTVSDLAPGTYTLTAPAFTDGDGSTYAATLTPGSTVQVKAGATANASAVYTVGAPQISGFSADPSSFDSAGGSLTLSWQGVNVTGYSLSVSPTNGVKIGGNAYTGPVSLDAAATSAQVTLPDNSGSDTQTYTFMLTASGAAGMADASKTAQATVNAPTTGNLALTISGILTNVSNLPTVTVTDSGGNTVASETANGTFTLPNLDPGTYTLSAPDFADDDGYDYAATLIPGATITVAAGDTATASVTYAVTTGNLEVSFTTPTGVTPSATLKDDGGTTVATLSGDKTVTGLTPGDYTLEAESVLYNGGTYNPDSETQQVSVTAGNTASASVTYTLHQTFPSLSSPFGITYDPSNGYLYVANLNNAITVYDEEGNQITTTGTFPNPHSSEEITYDPDNHYLYATNYGNSTIAVYDEDGNQITNLTGDFPNLSGPVGIAYDPDNGYLYVVNFSNNTITAYDAQGNQVADLTGSFPNLNSPQDITYDPDNGYLYVANFNNTITVYDEDGNQVTDLTGSFPNLGGPFGIAYDPSNGYLYVTDYGNNTIIAYDAQGNQITDLTGSFSNLSSPAGITYNPDNGYLYVTNYGSGTITVYDEDGNQVAP